MPKIDWDKAESYEPPMVDIRPFEEREVEVAFENDNGEPGTTEMLFPTVMLSDASRLKVKAKQKPPIAFLEDIRDDGGLKRALTPAREAEFREWLHTSRHLLTIQQAGYAILATTEGEVLGFRIEFPNSNNIPNEADDESWTLLYHWAKDEHPGASPAWIWKRLQSMQEQGVSAVSIEPDGSTPWVPTKGQLFEEFTTSRFMDAARVVWAKQAGVYEELNIDGAIVPVTGKLERNEYNHSFYAKALKGFEEIAFDGKGSFELAAKRGNRKAVLFANPDLCARYIGNAGANWPSALEIAVTVKQLLKKAGAELKAHGRIWLSLNTIIDNLTRTAQGVNTGARRNDAFRKAVNDALFALSSSQIQICDDRGKPIALGYMFNAEYRETMLDPAGNVLKDVWGFMPIEGDQDFLTLTARETTARPLLNCKPFNLKNYWISQYLMGGVISEIRAKLYPARGKGLKSYTATRSWNSVFDTAEPTTGGEQLSSRKKNRVVCDVQDVLVAIAEEEAEQDKPIYLQAKTAFGTGGKFVELKITGYKTYHAQTIDLGTTRRDQTKRKAPKGA